MLLPQPRTDERVSIRAPGTFPARRARPSQINLLEMFQSARRERSRRDLFNQAQPAQLVGFQSARRERSRRDSPRISCPTRI